MGWSLIPREEKFFALFEKLAGKVVEAAHLFRDLLADYQDIEAKAKAIKAVEHEADLVTHEVMDRLNKSFVTPLDREDIRALAQHLDSVVDEIEAAANCFVVYGVKSPTPSSIEMVGLMCLAVEQIQKAVEKLENLREINVFLIEIHRLENMADSIAREMIGNLFHEERDIRELIRWKEIYERLEQCGDRCEDVADTIEDIVVKNA
jgi:predicted phosphate transport protein (TIGR00153 family)